MNSQTGISERYIQLYRDNIDRIRDNSSPLLNACREEAIEKFRLLGLPDRKNESYRYTNLASFFNHDFRNVFMPSEADFVKAEEFRCDVAELDTHGIVLLNGFYPTLHDKIHELPGGAWIGSMNEAAGKYTTLVGEHYGRYLNGNNDALVHLNSAMANDGVFIRIPEGTRLKKPIQIVNLVRADEDIFNQHRNLIIVEKNTQATIIICDHTLSPGKFLTNAVTEIFVGENAHFDIIRIQNEHNNAGKITHTFIHQERNSRASSANITLHGGLVRNSTHHYLGGEGAECNSYGLYLSDKFQHVDNYVSVDHAFPHCTSNQLFKGVLDDMANGAFNGRIYVHQDAQKTKAYQKNNSILLTDDAKMDTKPQLEIYADDVKCSHGATVGQLDKEALFYLQSRGIDKREARLMLMFGFAHEVIQNINVEALRERIDNLVMQRLRGELSRCASCVLKCSE
ncbi:MAG TPA: Fe-S cluster assembly protein SufD [Bacteroidales bacterium]|nr:Fe-S cluster assembly protein SufD [Bacteroidales bacterium]HPJ58190.1 Fe-S cluster assembly protein SufD [Bacteroidales bacterium]HPR11521.1 Fe-S cluster assembly protein SufD [Bacteroidales bacterium]HRW84263.1 Fe-S cluster assembly protein SufD [Bacteroidales bacterium]